MHRVLRQGQRWVVYLLRYRSRLLVEPLMLTLLDRVASRASFEGIKIIALPTRKGEEPPFLADMVAALRLIQWVDPRRFRRVQREIVTVENALGLSFASYGRLMKRCSVDYARIDPGERRENPEWYQWAYAASLVHEATHGAIYSRDIQYTPKLRARIERLCCTEARRFATHADRENRQWSEALVPPF